MKKIIKAYSLYFSLFTILLLGFINTLSAQYQNRITDDNSMYFYLFDEKQISSV